MDLCKDSGEAFNFSLVQNGKFWQHILESIQLGKCMEKYTCTGAIVCNVYSQGIGGAILFVCDIYLQGIEHQKYKCRLIET